MARLSRRDFLKASAMGMRTLPG
ncbi:twin-arginine translocation signal domain-containing protein [Marinobacter halophilus]